MSLGSNNYEDMTFSWETTDPLGYNFKGFNVSPTNKIYFDKFPYKIAFNGNRNFRDIDFHSHLTDWLYDNYGWQFNSQFSSKSRNVYLTRKWQVEELINMFGQEIKEKAGFPEDKIISLRYNLIKEELDELKDAMKNRDLKEVADALTDILYVTYGAGHAFGVNLDKCFKEVQDSNMSKLDSNGKPIYNENGKVMKGPNYFKPDLEKFLL